MREPPEICPHCGADVPANAKACPECGSDDETGWSERASADRIGLPDEEFDHDEFVKEEFGRRGQIRPRGVSWFWWVVAVLLLVALLSWLWPK